MSDAAVFTPDLTAGTSASAAMLPLRVQDLTLRFREATVLEDLNLTLGPTGCTMIMGPNGAGKSLLLKLLHGLMQPSSGRIAWGALSPSEVTRRQALVFQKPVLLRRSVAANLDFVLRARGMDRARRDALLDHVAIIDRPERIGQRLRERYTGVLDRVSLYMTMGGDGELSRSFRRGTAPAQRRAEGVPIPDETWRQINELADRLGADLSGFNG